MDLDRFQRINSSFGYESGNALLLQVAQRLLESSESHGVVARLGETPSGFLSRGVGEQEGAEVFVRWLLRVFELPFTHDKIELFLSVSVGVVLVPGDGSDVFELLTNAELAMSVAKRQGGNSFRFYDLDMHKASADRVFAGKRSPLCDRTQ